METDNKRVGVFMQVYRNEPSMHQAIQSVLGQTYSNFKYYILVSEKTREDVGKYAEKDERIIIMDGEFGKGFRTHIKLVASDGNDYVTVIDADDWYEPDYLRSLVACAQKNHTDMLACGNFFVNEYGHRIGERVQAEMAWDAKDTGKVIGYMYGFYRTVWGKLISSECILKWEPEKLPTYEKYGGYGGDTLMMFDILKSASRVGICDKLLYNYRISSTGSSYKLMEGRLESDELLFHFVEDILLGFGEVREPERRFLFLVYANALIDTTRLLMNAKMTETERAEKLVYIFEKELSRELFDRQQADALKIPGAKSVTFSGQFYDLIFGDVTRCAVTAKTTELYLRLFEKFYPKWKGILSMEEFAVILRKKATLDSLAGEAYAKIFSDVLDALGEVKLSEAKTCLKLLRRLTSEALLKPLLQEKKFVLMYRDLVELLNGGQREKAMEWLHGCFSAEEIPYGDELLTELWINLAATLENVPEFIMGKQLQAELLLQKNRYEEGKSIYEELLDMGVQDDNMEYLKGILEKKGV